ncbi:MAG TPA: 2-C-methyl-D-erythritol 4-phosphate cytidylyltransferase [Acidobacteriota bacterium]|nr:2-C-methyl-D-erythritol 4-phosphate cytidylyltransferase [Acidobacteriota bacterium]
MTGLVLAAAGSGRRFGSEVPKQFLELRGRPLYLHSLETFLTYCGCAVVVVPPDHVDQAEGEVKNLQGGERILVRPGGEQRQDSVRRGLEALPEDADLVLVHDAARPFCSSALIERVIESARLHGGCIPVLPLSDTVKEVEEGQVVRTLERSRLRRVQTPQGFRRPILEEAVRRAAQDGFVGTDEASLVERLGRPVRTVEGEAANVKITWREDL